MNNAPKPVKQLRARASTLNKLIDKHTHPRVSLALQSAFGGLSASAEMRCELTQSVDSVIAESQQTKKRSTTAEVTMGLRALLIKQELPGLIDQAELLATGRDVQMYKALAKRSLSLTADIGAKLSGIGYIKDAADILGALKEVAEVGEAVKL